MIVEMVGMWAKRAKDWVGNHKLALLVSAVYSLPIVLVILGAISNDMGSFPTVYLYGVVGLVLYLPVLLLRLTNESATITFWLIIALFSFFTTRFLQFLWSEFEKQGTKIILLLIIAFCLIINGYLGYQIIPHLCC